MINARQIKELMDRGYNVSVENPTTGITDRYHPLKSGDIAVTYVGKDICMYCGRFSDVRKSCCCNGDLEVLSMTGAYRHVVEVAKSVSSCDVMTSVKRLHIMEGVVV